jgi:hypothetical protein
MVVRRVDADEGWINRKFAVIERRLEQMAAAKRLPASSLAVGSSLLIKGVLKVIGTLDLTGDLSMKSASDAELVRMGDMTYGRGLEFKRDDGSTAIRFSKPLSGSTVQKWELVDRGGTTVVAEGSLSPGLGRPFLELPFQPYAATSGTAVTCGPYGWERSSTSATWETLFVYDGKAQNSFLDFKFAAICSDATTAGQIQLYDLVAGAPMAAFFAAPWVGTIAAGTTSWTVIDPTPDQVVAITDGGSLQAGGAIKIAVQVQRTAGTGTITLAVPSAMGG